MDSGKPRIVIIDRNLGTREYLTLELKDGGYEVVAIDAIDPVHEIIDGSGADLVLLDPYIGGRYRWDILMDIRKRHRDLPVLLCLPFDAFHNDIPVALADDWWVKRFCTTGLISKVESLLVARTVRRP